MGGVASNVYDILNLHFYIKDDNDFYRLYKNIRLKGIINGFRKRKELHSLSSRRNKNVRKTYATGEEVQRTEPIGKRRKSGEKDTQLN